MPPLPRSHRPAVGVRRHSPGKGVLAGHAETARDLQGGCAVLASTGDRRQPLLGTLNRRPIIAPEALSKPPHWGPGLHSSLLAPRCREGGGMGGLPCPAPRRPSPPQAGVKAQSEGLQPWASPGAGPLGLRVGEREGGGVSCTGREGGPGEPHPHRRTQGGQLLLEPTLEGGLRGAGGSAQHWIQAATPPTPPPIQSPLGSGLPLGLEAPRPRVLVCDAKMPISR